MHDGRKQNGYAVYMYPVTADVSKIRRPAGVAMLYGKSFRSAEEALAEIQILKTNKILPRPKDQVVVRIRLDGSLSILWKGKTLLVEEIKTSNQGQSDPHAA